MHKVHTTGLTVTQKRELWLDIIRDYEQSDLTPREFCQQQQIKLDHFYYHMGVHRKQLQKKDTTANKMTFIPIMTKQEDNSSSFCLTTPYGIELHLSNAFDANHLLQILNVLRGASC